jgi:hypothetical protein
MDGLIIAGISMAALAIMIMILESWHMVWIRRMKKKARRWFR